MTPHQKIMRAKRRGKGLRLTAQEVERLAGDDAISTVASCDEEIRQIQRERRR